MFEPKWKSGVVKSVLETGCGAVETSRAIGRNVVGHKLLPELLAGTARSETHNESHSKIGRLLHRASMG
jgi:hypothetical protein